MSRLEVGLDNLSSVDYTDQIETITQVLKQTQRILFIEPTSVSFDIDAIASKVAAQITNSTRYPFENNQGTTYASSYFDDIGKKKAFSDQIGGLRQQIIQMVESALQIKVGHRDIQRYATGLLKPIADFSSTSSGGLKYPLTKALLFEKQRLHIRPNKTARAPWLKGHKLTIHVKDISQFDEQLIQGICALLRRQGNVKSRKSTTLAKHWNTRQKKLTHPSVSYERLLLKNPWPAFNVRPKSTIFATCIME